MILGNLQQDKIIHRAKDMVYLKWTPNRDIPMWNSQEKFKKGITYEGIPYTWSANQVRNSKEFLKNLSNNNLQGIEDKYLEPNYGNDCSGFVSAAWNIPRCTTHNIQKYTKEIDFKQLRPGDALLAEEHIMLFSNWNDTNHTKLTVYEQTPPKARMTTYSISYLHSENYRAVRLK
ncbi:hypothetical protein [Clostridium sp. DJ247]|uniref:hypothetical protein n=1 Tax=Clostridium sp. DJ247 TaxID=2726188 RepID=UPI0016279316|nr:hypothetical protein [Clostridium sp. DJ247]